VELWEVAVHKLKFKPVKCLKFSESL